MIEAKRLPTEHDEQVEFYHGFLVVEHRSPSALSLCSVPCSSCGFELVRTKDCIKSARRRDRSIRCKPCISKELSKRVTVKCQVCGKETLRKKKELKSARFCSKVCGGKWHATTRLAERWKKVNASKKPNTCAQCGCEFFVPPSRADKRFCRVGCYNEFRRKQRKQKKPKKQSWKVSIASKLKEIKCIDCGKVRRVSPNYYYPRCRPCSFRARAGAGNSNWKGGKRTDNATIRKSKAYIIWRAGVFDRDGFICQLCGQVGGKLHADHIQSFARFPELRLSLDNGRTLCVECHKKTPNFLAGALKEKSPPVFGFDWRSCIHRADVALALPSPVEHIERPIYRGQSIARFAFPLELCPTTNRTRHSRPGQHTKVKRCLLAMMQKQSRSIRGDLLSGRPQVLAVRFSSVEPDAYSDWAKMPIDLLCVPSGRRKMGMGYLREDRPKDAEVRQWWEPAKQGEGFVYMEVRCDR